MSTTRPDPAILVLDNFTSVIRAYERLTRRFNVLLSVPPAEFNDITYSNAIALITSATHKPRVRRDAALTSVLTSDRLREVVELLDEVDEMRRHVEGLQAKLERMACLYIAVKEEAGG